MITDIELAERMKAAGMITIDEAINGGPMDLFLSHTGVRDMETYGQWLEMRRRELVKQVACHDLKIHVLNDDVLDFILGQSYAVGCAHINLKRANGDYSV